MSMIDHDTQDEMRARSAADLDARRYRHIASGGIYRIHSQARSPDGPIYLVSADAPYAAMWTMQVSAAELALTFARCDGAHAAIAPTAIPTPDALRARFEAADASAVESLTARVATALESQWSPGARVVVDATEPQRVVAAVVARLRAQGWAVSQRDGRSLAITAEAPAVDPNLYR